MAHTYVPGPWTFLAGPELVLFTDAEPDADLTAECWRLVSGGGGVDEVLGAIVHEGLRAVGGFALVSRERLLMRGGVAVELVDPDGGRRPLASVTTPTWYETELDGGVAALALAMPGSVTNGSVLPLVCGVVLASSVVVSYDADVVAVPRSPRVHETEPGEVSKQYDELFAPSSVPPVRTAPAEETTVRLEESRPPAGPHVPATPSPASDDRSYASPPAAGVIDHLPWAPAGRGTAWAPADPVPERQPELGITLRRPRRPMNQGIRVSAVRCPAGHLNPIGADVCRVCRATVAAQEPFETARPRLGLLRLSTDPEPIPLDRGVVFGRAPGERGDADRIALQRPDISANHVEVRLSGWQVQIVDLGSTNGTVVSAPDGRSSQLTPHVPVEIEHGAEVVLSEEIRFRFEVTA